MFPQRGFAWLLTMNWPKAILITPPGSAVQITTGEIAQSVFIYLDGAVSPCLALLHTHESYLDTHVRKSLAFSVGSLREQSLIELCHDPAYIALRERLLQFDFSPCVSCNTCDMAEANQEDCLGNVAPTCGGCLWAQGFIQCP